MSSDQPNGLALDSATSPLQMDVVAVVAVGAVLGAEARYAVSRLELASTGGFPWGVLAVNAVGCLLIGVLAVLLSGSRSRLAWPFLAVGVLGGFTTFSTYALDAVQLLDHGRPLAAAAYLGGTVLAALAAVHLAAKGTRAMAAGGGGER